MPIPDDIIQRTSLDNEKIAEKRLKKMGFHVKRLDRQGPRRRPEFLVSDSSGPILLCEVKTIFSGGYLRDRNAFISTEDPGLNKGTFPYNMDFSRINECLSDAIRKCRTLSEDIPNLVNLPLLVVFFFDFFADYFDFYPRRMDRFPEVSGIAKIEVDDHEIRKRTKTMSSKELKAKIECGSMAGWPPSSKILVVVPNECATTPLPSHFLDRCLASP